MTTTKAKKNITEDNKNTEDTNIKGYTNMKDHTKSKNMQKKGANKTKTGKNHERKKIGAKEVKYTFVAKVPKEKEFKKELLEVDKQEEAYDKLFEKKLAEQYREFRSLKEHHVQLKKFVRVLTVLAVIILAALLLLTFG